MGAVACRVLGREAWPGPGPERAPQVAPQPNPLDLRRIERALAKRRRYRYVRPAVRWESDGYRIVSPCCSRNIDADGQTIDIARLEYDPARAGWRLYSKDHAAQRWALQAQGRLHELLALLNADPQRIFWQ